ncbi:MAG: hypothetical protein GVY36_07140, partial [Verrucomicrobia bacterium]|nr:hypothetical protein [Verrucomicrobiota bacterium]
MDKGLTANSGIRKALALSLFIGLLGTSLALRVEAQATTPALTVEIGAESNVALDSLFDWQPTVLLETTLGTIPIELTPEAAPKTVENFLFYVDSGRYTDSFIHRRVSLKDGTPFIIQGGGFFFNFDTDPVSVASLPTEDPVVNEFNASNTRGTVAMAKLDGDPDSATSQWFINMSDNGSNLDEQNGGFTVFGRVVGDGMTVAEAISEIPVYDVTTQLGSPFVALPLTDSVLSTENFVVIDSASRYAPEV